MNFDHVIETDGRGLWSRQVAKVKTICLDVPYTNKENSFGELRVYFDTKSWNVDSDGLIYTDECWLGQLREKLNESGLRSSDVTYSECGMQGDDYVSLDVGPVFLKSWKNA